MPQPLFIVFSGLPGTGKSTIARTLAAEIGAVWVRVDSLEQAIRAADVAGDDLKDAGYRAGYAAAIDNLKLGLTVIGDSVNPWMLTRNAWRNAGLSAGARVVEVETICSDAAEHRRRVETRVVDVSGLVKPDWRAVTTRDYHAWDRDHVVIDTAGRSVADCVAQIRAAL